MHRTRHRFAMLAAVAAPVVLAGALAVAQSGTGALPERSAIDEKHKWNLADLFADAAAWEREAAAVEQALPGLTAFKGKLGESADTLLRFLSARDDLMVRLERLSAYASMLEDEDTREAAPQALAARAHHLAVSAGEALAWFAPEVVALPEGLVLGWCRSHPKLGVYTHSFENLLRRQAHVLGPREEELMAMAGKVMGTPGNAFGMLANADMTFPTIKDEKGNDLELSEGRYAMLLRSSDRTTRERAFKGVLGAYLAYKNTLASLLAGSIQGDVFRARARRYDSALAAAVDADNVPVAVYDNLIDTINRNLPTFHRYVELRRKTLGLDKVHFYDLFVPLIDAEAPRIGYDDAVATILAGLQPLGSDYVETMKTGFANRWVDVYETPGKRSGAYSQGIYGAHPYILLNYSGTYDDMFTVAHEMGHSMHSWYSQRHQAPVNADYPIFLAEVASTGNEVILGDHLRRRATSDAERLYLVNVALEEIRGTVFTQTMWAEYEKIVHAEAEKGTPLTYETMSGLYRDLALRYYGPSFAYDDEVDGYWMRIPHFYRAFYVYKYATSYCASTALGRRILAGEPGALDQYLGFLKAGGSDYPIDILEAAGVDMRTAQPIQQTMDLFAELLDELERLLARP